MRTGPDYIQFYPTVRCDRSCGFCFNRSLPQLPDMTAALFERMLARLPGSVATIDIMGGEPSLHRDIVAIITSALVSGRSVNISSNGYDLGVLQQVNDLGSAVTVGVSVNDRSTLSSLEDFIRTTAPVVKTVHGRKNDPGLLQDLLDLASGRAFLIYRDAASSADLPATVPFPDFLEVAARMAGRAGTVFCSGFLPDTERYPELSDVRCPAGTTKLGVLPDGSVYPCNLFFGNPDFLLGNILTDPFDRIWQHEKLSFFRSFTTNACAARSCTLHGRCHGGCPSQSLLVAGDIAAPDPRCSCSPGNLLY